MITQLGGRKFLALSTALAIALIAVAVKGDVPPGLCDMLKWCFGLFVMGNVGAGYFGSCSDSQPPPAIVQQDHGPALADLKQSIDTLSQNDHQMSDQAGATQQAVVTIQQMLSAICKKYQI